MILIKNGLVYTMTGEPQPNTDVLIEGSKIMAVGPNLEAPSDAQIFDATDKLVMPGFIDAHCHVGTFGTAIGKVGEDVNEVSDPVTPQMRVIDGINPMDQMISEGASGGVTTVGTGPGSANIVGGTFAVMKLHGHRVDDMVINDRLGMKCAFGENPKRFHGGKGSAPATRMGTASKLRELLFKTKEYAAKKEAADEPSKMPAFDMKLEAMIPVIKGEIPLKAHAHQADDIFTAIRIAKEFDVKLTLEHCTEGHLIAEDLAKEGYPAIVGPSFGFSTKYELQHKSFKTPKILMDAGVKVAIMTDAPIIPIENLPLAAAFAHREGLTEMEALKAITVNPAEILEVSHRIGTIETGKDADVVIWEGHPFNVLSKVDVTIINGEIAHKAE